MRMKKMEFGQCKPIAGVKTNPGFFLRFEGRGLDIGEVYLTASQNEETQKAIARRLVACWNACCGIETETLERINETEKNDARLASLSFEAQAAMNYVPGSRHRPDAD